MIHNGEVLKDYAYKSDLIGLVEEQTRGSGLLVEIEDKNYKNYGHFLELINPADNMAWDCFAPGYSYRLPLNTEFRVVEIYGVLLLKNGNHKVCVGIDFMKPDKDVWHDIEEFKKSYENKTNKKMRLI